MNEETIELLKQNNFIPTDEPYIWLKELGYDYNLQGETYEEIDLTNDNRRKDIEKIIGKKIKINKEVNKKETIKTDDYLPTHEDVMRGTKPNEYKTLSFIISNSNFNKEGERMEAYVYDYDIKKKAKDLKEQGIKGVPSLSTLKRHINVFKRITIGEEQLKLLTIENSPNGLVYKIAQNYDGKWFQIIPCEQLKELIFLQDNVLKLLIIFKYTCNETEYKTVDRNYLCRHMGMEETKKCRDNITTMVNILIKLGYIYKEYDHINKADKDGELNPCCICRYKLATFEEWKMLNKNIGKNKK